MEALRFTLHLNTHDQHAHHTPGTLGPLAVRDTVVFTWTATSTDPTIFLLGFCLILTGPNASNTPLIAMSGGPFEVDRSDGVTTGTQTLAVIDTVDRPYRYASDTTQPLDIYPFPSQFGTSIFSCCFIDKVQLAAVQGWPS
ncbi:hypothetical protein C8J56DRAFT_1051272 [Mycena floridula]|nr:hypothetical protein C8J56DRAFT_1051272 [Mycena floridula]